MSIGLGLTILVMAIIAVTLLAGRFCHIGDLESDPLDSSAAQKRAETGCTSESRRGAQ